MDIWRARGGVSGEEGEEEGGEDGGGGVDTQTKLKKNEVVAQKRNHL